MATRLALNNEEMLLFTWIWSFLNTSPYYNPVCSTPLVSICIPAYNQQYFLDRLVNSIKEQTYRPIEIIIVDDNSPIPLVARDGVAEDNLHVRIQRNSESYGPYWNMLNSISLSNGEYVYQIDHDDYLIDSSFIQKAVNLFENIPNLQLVIANSEIENSKRTSLPRANESGFRHFDGISFLRKHLFNEYHPARSGYIMNYKSLVKIKFKKVFYALHHFSTQEVYPDESFSLPVILCSLGDVLVSNDVVSVHGNPQDSFSKSDFWRKNSNISVIVQFVRLASFLFAQRSFKAAFIISRKCIFGGNHSPKIHYHNLNILKEHGISKYIKLVIVLNFLVHFPALFLKRVFYSFRFRILGR